MKKNLVIIATVATAAVTLALSFNISKQKNYISTADLKTSKIEENKTTNNKNSNEMQNTSKPPVPLQSLEYLIEENLYSANYDRLDELTILYIKSEAHSRLDKIDFLYSKMIEFDVESILFSYILDTLEQLKPLELSMELTDLYEISSGSAIRNRIINVLNYSTLITAEIDESELDVYVDHVLYLKAYFLKETLATKDDKLQKSLIRAYNSTATQEEVNDLLDKVRDSNANEKNIKDIQFEIILTSNDSDKIESLILSSAKNISENGSLDPKLLSYINSMKSEKSLTDNKEALLTYLIESEKLLFSKDNSNSTSMINWIDLNSEFKSRNDSIKTALFSNISNQDKAFIINHYQNEIKNFDKGDIVELITKISSSPDLVGISKDYYDKSDVIKFLKLQLEN